MGRTATLGRSVRPTLTFLPQGFALSGRRAENSLYFAAASGTLSLSLRSALHLSINLLVHHRSHAVYGYLLRDTPEILRLLAQVALHWRRQPKAGKPESSLLNPLAVSATVGFNPLFQSSASFQGPGTSPLEKAKPWVLPSVHPAPHMASAWETPTATGLLPEERQSRAFVSRLMRRSHLSVLTFHSPLLRKT